MRALLDSGANPNEIVSQLALTAPVLARVARLGDVETMRALLDRGADPNLKGSAGLTALMMAAATTSDPAMVRLLIERGAAVGTRDDAGNTALDWALTLGETEAHDVLRKAGAISMARPASRPLAVLHQRSARAAVEVAIERLQAADLGFTNKTRCISCHNQSLPAVAVKRAASKGATINRALSSHPTAATLAMWGRSRENMLVGNCSILGFLGNVTYGLFGLAEEAVAPTPETDAVTTCLSGLQKPDGSWKAATHVRR